MILTTRSTAGLTTTTDASQGRCDDCVHAPRCRWFLGKSYSPSGPCDWIPSRFVAFRAPSANRSGRTELAPVCLLAAVALICVGVPYVARAFFVCGLMACVVWSLACLLAVATEGDEEGCRDATAREDPRRAGPGVARLGDTDAGAAGAGAEDREPARAAAQGGRGAEA